jgi:hypothetical protein
MLSPSQPEHFASPPSVAIRWQYITPPIEDRQACPSAYTYKAQVAPKNWHSHRFFSQGSNRSQIPWPRRNDVTEGNPIFPPVVDLVDAFRNELSERKEKRLALGGVTSAAASRLRCSIVEIGATRSDRTGDLLITKYDQRFQRLDQLYTEVPVINNLGKLLSLKEQLPQADLDGGSTQLTVSALLDGIENLVDG